MVQLLGYKVVRRGANGRLYSCYAPGVAKLEYKVGEKTTRKEENGPLALFHNMESALEFLGPAIKKFWNKEDRPLAIFKCRYEESIAELSEEAKEYLSYPEEIVLWCTGREGTIAEVIDAQALPEGTMLADWIELIEPVEGWE